MVAGEEGKLERGWRGAALDLTCGAVALRPRFKPDPFLPAVLNRVPSSLGPFRLGERSGSLAWRSCTITAPLLLFSLIDDRSYIEVGRMSAPK